MSTLRDLVATMTTQARRAQDAAEDAGTAATSAARAAVAPFAADLNLAADQIQTVAASVGGVPDRMTALEAAVDVLILDQLTGGSSV